jgi:class 3 adenylate cyclase
MIANEDVTNYLLHRSGTVRMPSGRILSVKKALQLNTPQPNFDDTFGKSELSAYVGFIDLAGFSESVHGQTPRQIADFLSPFMRESINILRSKGALIDKTIGDELMFVLPEWEEDPIQLLLLGQILSSFHDLAAKLEGHYKYRIGLSYGKIYVSEISGEGYSELTIFGEVVHVAKRIVTIPELEFPNPTCGAFALPIDVINKDSIRELLAQKLSVVAGFASRYKSEPIQEPVSLKGVGDLIYAVFKPSS